MFHLFKNVLIFLFFVSGFDWYVILSHFWYQFNINLYYKINHIINDSFHLFHKILVQHEDKICLPFLSMRLIFGIHHKDKLLNMSLRQGLPPILQIIMSKFYHNHFSNHLLLIIIFINIFCKYCFTCIHTQVGLWNNYELI